MVVDWSLRLGDMISFVGFAGGAFSFILLMKSDIRVVSVRVGHLEDTVKKETEAQNRKIDKQSEEIGHLGDLITVMGRHEERMSNLRRDIDELRRGRGFIVPPPISQSEGG